MADSGISYRIELDSAEAEQALGRLQGAAAGLAGQFQKMAEAVSAGGLGTFTKLAEAAAAAVAGLTGALFAVAKASSAAVDELGEMAAQMGSTVEEMSTLRSALGQFEANTDTLQRAFNRMGNTLQEIMPAVQKSVADAAGNMQKDLNSVATASLGVAEAEAKLRELQTGAKTPTWLAEELALKKQIIAVDQARVAEDAAIAKATEGRRNDIRQLAKYVDALAKGVSTAGIEVNVTVDNLVKGLIASVGPAAAALDGVGGSFNEISQRSPQLRTALFTVADMFEHMKDSTLKMAFATRLFGRKDAKDMVEALSVGSAALKEQETRLRSLGLVITDVDSEISRKFIAGMNRLGNAIGIISTQFGLLFQPAFTTLLNGMATALENNRATIISWGEAIRDTVGPVLESLGRALAGTARAGEDDWAVRFIANVTMLGQAVSAVFFGLVIPAFIGLKAMADGVALAINSVLGTALNAFDLLAGVIGARMALAFGALLIGLGPVKLAIIAVALALGLVIKYLPQIKTMAASAWDAFTVKVSEATEWINRVFGTNFTANAVAIAGAVGLMTLAFVLLRGAVAAVSGVFGLIGAGFTALAASGPVLLAVLGAIAVALIAFNWDKLKEGAGRAFDAVVGAAQQMLSAVAAAVGRIVESLGAGIATIATSVGSAFGNIIASIGTGIATVVTSIGTALAGIPTAIGTAVSGIVTSIGTAFGSIAIAIGTAIGNIITSIGTAIAGIATSISSAIVNIVSAVGSGLAAVGTSIGAAFGAGLSSSITSAINTGLQSAIAGIGTALQAVPWIAFEGAGMSAMAIVNGATNMLIGTIQQLTAEIEKAAAAYGQLQGRAAGGLAGPGGPKLASGGLLGGRGTGTSDSNLAWLSRGEYITPARAVRQPGVLAFLEALRRSGGNLRDVLDGMGRFAVGGLVAPTLSIPAFAAGGSNRDLGTLHLALPSGQTFAVRASSDVVDELRKAAAMAQIRSGGRKPSRYS